MFTSSFFLIGFPVCFAIYYLFPIKWKNIILLICSYLFCYAMVPIAVPWLFAFTIFSFFSAKLINRLKSGMLAGICTVILAGCIIVILVICKHGGIGEYNVVAPIGISFYTLEMIGYMVDVYHEDIEPERNFISYALYVSFFPKLVSGPIEKESHLLKQIHGGENLKEKPTYEMLKKGAILILWGYWEKIVIADHASIIVNEVFANYSNYSGVLLAKAVVLYGVQLYADFDGYSNIARGCATLLGFDLIINFEQPYFSRSIQEFWKKWHISLSWWLRDYIYIPLGGNRKGKFRKYTNVFLTFLISGLWHGFGFKFLVWGGLHGIYQIVGDGTKGLRQRLTRTLHINTVCFSYRLFQGMTTFILVDFAWIFFRATGAKEAIMYIGHMFADFYLSELAISTFANSITTIEGTSILPTMAFGIVILLIVDMLHKRCFSISKWLGCQNFIFQMAFFSISMIFLFFAWVQTIGLDVSAFIYAQF